MVKPQEILTLSHVNLLVVDNWLSEGKATLEEVGEAIPSIFSKDDADLPLDYLNPQGHDQLDISPERLQELRRDFFEIYIHPRSLGKFLPKIREIYMSANYALVHSELERVWFPKEREYKLCLVNIKLSRSFDGLFTTIQPIEELDYMAERIRRLGEESEFMAKHYRLYRSLTGREREIICLLARGLNNPGIADELTISRKTVEQHRKNINKKLGIHSFVHLLRYAQAFGLV